MNEPTRRAGSGSNTPDLGDPRLLGTRILLVDDDRELIDLLAYSVRRSGLEPIVAYDGPGALRQFECERPSLAVLDVNLGAMSGLDVLQQIRRKDAMPVILLTANAAEDDKVRGLNMGAADYLTKPFSHRELIARIRARLRHDGGMITREGPTAQGPSDALVIGPLLVSVAQHSATRDGVPLDLSAMEFRLLYYLMLHAGVVVPTGVLLRQVWGYEESGGQDVVRVTLGRLRRKLGEDAKRSDLLRTVPGFGIMLQVPASSPSQP